jgi:Protein of unknown function (DUF2589)
MTTLSSNFVGLPMADLIGAPLNAAGAAQSQLAGITTKFIKDLIDPETGKPMTVDFSYNANGQDIAVKAPLLSIVNIPSLLVKEVDIDFVMEVKAQTKDTSSTEASVTTKASYSSWWSPVSVSVTGTVTSKSGSERSTDNAAKYTVHVHASDTGPPEGLAKMIHLLEASIPHPSNDATNVAKPTVAPGPAP